MKQALEALENNRWTHHYCEDTWYSCPKHEEGCANDSEGDECNCGADKANAEIDAAITALRTAIAEAEKPEPVAWMFEKPTFWNRTPQKFFTESLVGTDGLLGLKPLYTTPPAAQRQWVGFTDEEVSEYDYMDRDFVRDIEAVLKHKNTRLG